jgi:hypothetical protein
LKQLFKRFRTFINSFLSSYVSNNLLLLYIDFDFFLQLNINLEKIEALEGKIKSEMVTLKEKMAKMEEELLLYSDLVKMFYNFPARIIILMNKPNKNKWFYC